MRFTYSAIFILALLLFVPAAGADYFNPALVEKNISDDFIDLSIDNSYLSLCTSLLYSKSMDNYSVSAGLGLENYGSIDITALPDSSMPVSETNIPYSMQTVSLNRVFMPVSILFRQNDSFIWGIENIFSYTDLYSAHFFTNTVNAIVIIKGDSYSGAVKVRDVFTEAGLMGNNLGLYGFPALQMEYTRSIISDELWNADIGISIEAGRNDMIQPQYTAGKYGFSRSLVISGEFRSMGFRVSILGPAVIMEGDLRYNDIRFTAGYSGSNELNHYYAGVRFYL
ncbi:MAG: hypothetical protein R6U31_02725 [bacterium]